MIHTVLFDIGGTLVHGKSSLIGLAEQMDSSRIDHISRYMIDTFMAIYRDENYPRFHTIKELLAISVRKAAEKFDLPDISDQVERFYRRNHLEEGYLYDDTVTVLKELKNRGIRMILVSDADADVLVEQLENFGILDFFEARVISSHVGSYKPSRRTVAEVRRHCRKPLDGILFVGDTRVDVRTAQRLGVVSVLINRDGDFRHEADHRITGLSELLDIIETPHENRGLNHK